MINYQFPLQFGLDAHIIGKEWKNFDFDSAKVLAMAAALSPAYLRIGGTASNLLLFDEDESDVVSVLIKIE